MRVAIVGAGIGGLAAAGALRRAGVEADVYERRPGPQPIGAGLHLWPNALHALRSVGVAEEVERAGLVVERRLMINQGGRTLGDLPTTELYAKAGAPTVTISRPALNQVLLRAVGEETVGFGRACSGVTVHPDRVELAFEDGTSAEADAVVGADGIGSRVRADLLGSGPAPPTGFGAWRTVIDWPDEDQVFFRIFFGARRVFVTYPVAPGRRYFLATMQIEPGSDPGPERRREWLLGHYAPFPRFVREILEAIPADVPIHHTDLADREPVEAWGEGRATLLGDAAHPMTPFTAMGACTAIEDAAVLARELARAGDDVAGALRAYERERIPRTTHFVEESRKVGRLMHQGNPVVRPLRDLLFPIVIRMMGPRPTVEEMSYLRPG